MYKYRISKYNPQYRNTQGAYLRSEWTSVSDIGQIYDGKLFDKEEYLDIEQKYCAVILDILCDNEIDMVMIQDLECSFSIKDIHQMLNPVGLFLSEKDEEIIKGLQNNMILERSILKNYLKLLLRECFWCKLNDCNSNCQIEFGYDYYVYVSGVNIADDLISQYQQKGVFIETLG